MQTNTNRYFDKLSGHMAANIQAPAKHFVRAKRSPVLSRRALRRIVAEMLG